MANPNEPAEISDTSHELHSPPDQSIGRKVIRIARLGAVYKFGIRVLDSLLDTLRSGSLRSLGLLLAGEKSIYKARQHHALTSTVAFVEQHLPHVHSSRNRKELLTRAFKAADVSGGRLICEFGVFKADTLNHLAQLTDRQLFGFDSFQGLPHGQSDHWEKGRFAVAELPKVRPNVTLVNGWFDETVPGFLLEHSELVGFLHIDCDLYSSTKTIFELFEGRLCPGTVIVFDEFFNYPSWQDGEFKALNEFLDKTGLSVEYIGYNRNGEQLAIKLMAGAP